MHAFLNESHDLLKLSESICRGDVDGDVLEQIERRIHYGLEALKNVTLHPYQLTALRWMTLRYDRGVSCILADEMGLGKTLESLAFLACQRDDEQQCVKALVLCPLSVVETWEEHIERFWPQCRLWKYVGANRQDQNRLMDWDILIASYETFLRDYKTLENLPWACLVVDEGHRLKSHKGKLYRILSACCLAKPSVFKLLLTGTPVQNDLTEFWALLHFILPSVFRDVESDTATLQKTLVTSVVPTPTTTLQHVVDLLVLRRRVQDVPSVSCKFPAVRELTLSIPMTHLQRSLYLSLLKRDTTLIEKITSGGDAARVRCRHHSWLWSAMETLGSLNNLLMQLRKCANHPYLFPNVEPEPFIEGDHLCFSSGKMIILQKLLAYYESQNKRVLLFSGSTAMLDIVQDYLDWTSKSYERLDGSLRGDLRGAAIQRFMGSAKEEQQPFVFLLSTRAGGVGLNLTAASVVIFICCDWNPQCDLQALSRVVRQGQQASEVTVIRLVASDTVDEVVLERHQHKLQLAHRILNDSGPKAQLHAPLSLVATVCHGLDRLLEKKDTEIEWKPGTEDPVVSLLKELSVEEMLKGALQTKFLSSPNRSVYEFEGVDFEKLADANGTTARGDRAFAAWQQLKDKEIQDPSDRGLCGKHRLHTAQTRGHSRSRLFSYTSHALCYEDHAESIPTSAICIGSLLHVQGDASFPICQHPWIILHTVDTSGRWPQAGFFKALNSRWPSLSKYYSQAHRNKDLHPGDAHLVPINYKTDTASYVGFLVAQRRHDDHRYRGALDEEALRESLIKLTHFITANGTRHTVHLPRIGAAQGYRWYSIERLLCRYLVTAGLKVFIYYYQPHEGSKSSIQSSADRHRPHSNVSDRSAVSDNTSKRQNTGAHSSKASTTTQQSQQRANPIEAWVNLEETLLSSQEFNG